MSFPGPRPQPSWGDIENVRFLQAVYDLLNGSPGTSGATEADWTPPLIRYFVVDPVSGDDIRPGYVDAAAGANLSALAPPAAIKTLAHLITIVPRVGAGRDLVVLLRSGTYSEPFTFVGFGGYDRIIIRSTADFSNTATDKSVLSSVTFLSGPGSGGAFSVNAAPAPTVNTFTVSAGALTAEPALLGCRVRFLSGARAGESSQIQSNTVGQIVLLDDLTGAPTAGDTFLVEDPGAVITGKISIGSCCPAFGEIQSGGAFTMAGISYGSTLVVDGETDFYMSFVKGTSGFFPRRCQFITSEAFYYDESVVAVETGVGHYGGGQFDVQDCTRVVAVAAQRNGAFFQRNVNSSRTYGCFVSPSRIINSGATGPLPNDGFGATVGPNAFQVLGRADTRLSGLIIEGSAVLMSNCILNSGTITVRGSSSVYMSNVSGTTAGAFGITVEGYNNRLLLSPPGDLGTVTVTGASGDIGLVQDSVIVSNAGLMITNCVDTCGNEITGHSGKVIPSASVFSNVSGTALSVGEIVHVSSPNSVTRAQADSAADASGPLLVSITSPSNNAGGLFVSINTPQKWILHDAAPTLANTSYLDDGTAGLGTSAVPPVAGTNQKRRLGQVARVTGNLGLVTGSAELLPVLSDGIPD